MTKEELAIRFEECFDANTRATYGGGADATNPYDLWKSFELHALEYARRQAIDFDIWKLKNHWVWNNSICKYFKWDGDDLRETSLSHEEIYLQFIEQQTKEK